MEVREPPPRDLYPPLEQPDTSSLSLTTLSQALSSSCIPSQQTLFLAVQVQGTEEPLQEGPPESGLPQHQPRELLNACPLL